MKPVQIGDLVVIAGTVPPPGPGPGWTNDPLHNRWWRIATQAGVVPDDLEVVRPPVGRDGGWMSGPERLVAFVRARLDEDEQTARDASGRDSSWVVEQREDSGWWKDDHPAYVIAGGKPVAESDPEYGGHGLVATHIARHDPARVLADVAAKRALLAAVDGDPFDAMGAEGAYELLVIQHLAMSYVDHPGYDEAWRPEVI